MLVYFITVLYMFPPLNYKVNLAFTNNEYHSLFSDLHLDYHFDSATHLKIGAIFKLGDSPQYPLVRWEKFISGDWSELFLKYKKHRISFLLGRWSARWGYSNRYSLILNDTLPARNGFWIKFKFFPELNFEYFISSESSYNLKRDFISRGGDTLKAGESIQRTLIGHKIEFNKNKLRLYFSEVAYCPSIGYFPNPKYLNPFFLYFLLQFNDAQLNSGIGVDANILWDFGWELRFKKSKLYGEFLIDDFQYKKEQTNEPPQAGFLVGLEQMMDVVVLTFEYTRVWAWTYLHENPWERYETYGYPLGHPYGPDFDNIYFKVQKSHDSWAFSFSISYCRKGEPNINTNWPIRPYGNLWDKFPDGSGFLFGVTEHRFNSRITLSSKFKRFRFKSEIGINKYWNWKHKVGNEKVIPIGTLMLEYSFHEKKSY